MTKREINLLERAFAAEISGALNKSHRIMQTKSKLAEKLVDDGLLKKVEEKIGGGDFSVNVSGYELTESGRFAYCRQC